MTRFRDVAIAAIGGGCGHYPSLSSTHLASGAITEALADGGLRRGDIDGLIVQIGSPRGVDYDVLARLGGLNVRFAAQPWSHGRFTATVIQHAALAVQAGLANCVVCVAAYRNSPFGRHGMPGYPSFGETVREGSGPHAENPALGMAAPVAGAAMAAQRYLHKFGVAREKLGAVATSLRRHASLNPGAVLREPLSLQQYMEARYVVEPLRLLDCSIPVDTAVAIVVCAGERARQLPQPPVYVVAGRGISAGPDEFIFGQPGLGINQAAAFDFAGDADCARIYADAGIAIDDIDTLHIYDAFTTQVLWTLERFGFSPVGQAADWIQGGRIELGGELPVNTSGGMLSEGHTNGWGHTLEIVRQLRGQAGDRQVAGAQHAQWATGLGDAVIYSNVEH